jgi:hypothetical protein
MRLEGRLDAPTLRATAFGAALALTMMRAAMRLPQTPAGIGCVQLVEAQGGSAHQHDAAHDWREEGALCYLFA